MVGFSVAGPKRVLAVFALLAALVLAPTTVWADSLGRLFYEPIWVFTRGDMPISSLRDLERKKIMVGSRED